MGLFTPWEFVLKNFVLALALASATLATPAFAATAITGFTGGLKASSVLGSTTNTVGYKFSPHVNISVSSLGLYDTGFVGSHPTGIFSSDGHLLSSATISSASMSIGGFLYNGIASTLLVAGKVYYIGSLFDNGNSDTYYYRTTTLSTSSLINFLGASYANGLTLTAPTTTTSTFNGRFGPNFMFTAASVPESATWGMMLVGMGAIGLAIRRRAAIAVLSD